MNDRLSLRDGDGQQTNPCRTKSKAQASSTEEEVTSTSGLSLKKKDIDQSVVSMVNTMDMMWFVWVRICCIMNTLLWGRSTTAIDLCSSDLLVKAFEMCVYLVFSFSYTFNIPLGFLTSHISDRKGQV